MNNERLHNNDVEFEREDLSAGGVFAFLVGLAITGFLLHLILVGMYRYLDLYTKTHERPQNPLVARPVNEDLRQPRAQEANQFPTPRLEINERSQLDGKWVNEEQTLDTYGWVDQQAGVAHIPIDRAMDLIVQRGLPSGPTGTKVRPGATPKEQPRQGVRELEPTPTTKP